MNQDIVRRQNLALLEKAQRMRINVVNEIRQLDRKMAELNKR